MRGQASRRGIVRFGHDYGPVGGDHHTVRPLTPELIRLRERAVEIAGLSAKEFIRQCCHTLSTWSNNRMA